MKKVFKSAALIALAGAVSLSSCKKEQEENVESTKNYVEQERDNNFLQKEGKAEVVVSGSLADYAVSDGGSYSEELKLEYINDNLSSPSTVINTQETKDTLYTVTTTYNDVETKTDTSVSYSNYTTKSYSITMYGASG